MQVSQSSLFDELESALQGGASEQRLVMLRRVTDLFLNEADRFNEEQIGVFDDVLGHLIKRVETRTLAQLSERLATVENAPRKVSLGLALHDEIAVARPILVSSSRLTTGDLVEIAKTKGQDHLLAISKRSHIETEVTDVLMDRGDRSVIHNVANNSGAKFSEHGFAALLKAAENDEALAEKAGLRLDLPLKLLRELLLRATEAVRSRLLAKAPADFQDEIRRALETAVTEVGRESSKLRDYATAQRITRLLKDRGELTDSTVRKFAVARQYEETVAGLALLASASIEIIKPLMDSPRDEGLLVACKGAGLSWQTVSEILQCKYGRQALPMTTIEKLNAEFAKLTRSNAERLLRFWQVRRGGTAYT